MTFANHCSINYSQSSTFQIIPSPAGPVGNCPSPAMMHSPMQGVQGGPQGYGMGANQGPN